MQKTGTLNRISGVFQRSAVLRWLVQARRLPMYYAVMILVSIFYHYAPSMTPLWILLSLLLQAALFRMFDYVKQHPVIGGALYVLIGICLIWASGRFIRMGHTDPLFAPSDPSQQIYFFVWFMTPQSVLVTSYPGYTIALFLLFFYFIGSITYYFTYVRYRVLMSFVIMLFPFEIYAKENEVMPVPFIILLFACYFAVMIYCRQARTEDPAVTAPITERGGELLVMPARKSSYAGVRPELLDGRFLRSAGLFLSAACIAVLVIPKPDYLADRRAIDSLINMSSVSDYLMSAISGFADDSDGGSYSQTAIRRALFYTNASEPLNLRVRTLTNYHYDTDSWSASDYDLRPDSSDYNNSNGIRYSDDFSGFSSSSDTVRPDHLVNALHEILGQHPDLAQKWNLTEFAGKPAVSSADYERTLTLETAGEVPVVIPEPLDVFRMGDSDPLHQNRSDIIFRYTNSRWYAKQYTSQYISPTLADNVSVKRLTQRFTLEEWQDFLTDVLVAVRSENSRNRLIVQKALVSLSDAERFAASVRSETPDSVRALAGELTGGIRNDYDKAVAVWQYLKLGNFTYSLEFQKGPADNTETFLFQHRTGVCYQFAGAMVELCRAAGLPTRYIEGYSMSQRYDRLTSNWDFIISTEHGHAFVEVYIAGYGWMPFDPTAGTVQTELAENNTSVISSLQIWGAILLAAALLIIFMAVKGLPMIREALFRRKFRRTKSAESVQEAFARLRRQWQANPSRTVRQLCAEQGAFLNMDLEPLADGVEQTVYAERCTPELADRIYALYCAAFDARKPAIRQQKRTQRRKSRRAVPASNS